MTPTRRETDHRQWWKPEWRITIGNYLIFVPLVLLLASAGALYAQKEIAFDRMANHIANRNLHMLSGRETVELIDRELDIYQKPLLVRLASLEKNNDELREALVQATVAIRQLERTIYLQRRENKRQEFEEWQNKEEK